MKKLWGLLLVLAVILIGSDVNWHEAKDFCEKYDGGGYNNWRMPTLNELAELYDKNNGYTTPRGYYDFITDFIQLASCCVWSSDARDSEAAYFSFLSNMQIWMSKLETGNGKRRALPVRSVK